MMPSDSTKLFTGRISITNLKGKFIIGYRVKDGILTTKLIKTQNQSTTRKYQKGTEKLCEYHENGDTSCMFTDTELDEVVVMGTSGNNYALDPFVNEGNGDYEYDYTLDWNFGDGNPNGGGSKSTNCPGIKILNPVTSVCECPDGYVEDSSGNCVIKCETTLADLQKVFPNTDSSELQKIIDYLNKHGKDFGIDTDEELQHFLAQAGHESKSVTTGKEFEGLEENLNYRWSELGTKGYWDDYFNPISNPTQNPNKADPRNFKRSTTSDFVDIRKFANLVYDDANRRQRYKMGNTNVGDGYKYRGRGIFQLTGKYNYQQFTSYYQNKYKSSLDFSVNPNLIATNKEIAVISALWFFKNKVGNLLANTTVAQVTKKINGGKKGLQHRKALFNKAKTNIKCK
ncbi:hypothetical protein [Polaribacter gochangensis]|uniref:hypothetical protein n=1 Tax=Polaribacter gochangensis TaxID=3252903 RepID=UPI003904DBE3